MKPWKIQKFFGDVVYDLRSRGLLPIAIVLVVAMVAVPMLISRGSSGSSDSSLQPTAAAAETAPEAQNAVVSYSPGIRDYRKRLEGLSPKNPFRQQFAQSAEAASQLNSTVQTSTTATDTSGGSSDSPAVSLPPVDTGGSTGTGKKRKAAPKTYSYSVTVMAGDVNTTLTPFKAVPSLTPLPAPTTPVVVYYGLSSDNAKALFLVSNKVSTLTGPGTCLPAPDDCSLLALGSGESEDLLYGLDGKTYRVLVSEIKRFTK